MSQDVSISGKALTVPLSLLVAGGLTWATYVTMQLSALREDIAALKAVVSARHVASAKTAP